MKKNVFLLFAIILFATAFNSSAQSRTDDILGIWIDNKQSTKIEMYKSGDRYHGKIIWLSQPNDPKTGKPLLDNKNANVTIRTVPILGLPIIKGLEFRDDYWGGGSVYDPESGKTYDAKIVLVDQKIMKMTGYLGISMFGRTEIWKRTK